MKLNIYQKILLVIYGCLFIYFGIIHVPFKTAFKSEIKYDTLFSENANVDIARLTLILFLISIIASVFFFLLRNLHFSFKTFSLKKNRILTISGFVILLFLLIAIIISNFQVKDKVSSNDLVKRKIEKVIIPSSDTINSISNVPEKKRSIFQQFEVESCSEEQALRDFKLHMEFYFPDWKIYGKPVLKKVADCFYQIRFTTINPMIRYEKEVIVVEISYKYKIDKSYKTLEGKVYYFKTIRGNIY